MHVALRFLKRFDISGWHRLWNQMAAFPRKASIVRLPRWFERKSNRIFTILLLTPPPGPLSMPIPLARPVSLAFLRPSAPFSTVERSN